MSVKWGVANEWNDPATLSVPIGRLRYWSPPPSVEQSGHRLCDVPPNTPQEVTLSFSKGRRRLSQPRAPTRSRQAEVIRPNSIPSRGGYPRTSSSRRGGGDGQLPLPRPFSILSGATNRLRNCPPITQDITLLRLRRETPRPSPLTRPKGPIVSSPAPPSPPPLPKR